LSGPEIPDGLVPDQGLITAALHPIREGASPRSVIAAPHLMREGASPRSAIAAPHLMPVGLATIRLAIREAVSRAREQGVGVDVDAEAVAGVRVAATRATSRPGARTASAAATDPWRR